MKWFTLQEFTRSVTANIRGLDNTPPQDAVLNLEWLCQRFLDPLRDAIGVPIIISSGYRCRDLNTAVGGSETSYHMLGLAADFHPLARAEDVSAALRQQIIALVRQSADLSPAWKKDPDGCPEPPLHFHQFIQYPTFFHVSVAPEGSTDKFQLLRYNGFGQGYHKD